VLEAVARDARPFFVFLVRLSAMLCGAREGRQSIRMAKEMTLGLKWCTFERDARIVGL